MATVEPISRDLTRIKAQVSAMTPLQAPHPYLEHERHISAEIQTSPRFARRIYTDPHGNAVFPHSDQDGLCGFEIRNTRFKGFAKGGCKGLWYSNHRPDDHALVITESAIEALSYHALHHPEGTRYFSIASQTGRDDLAIIEHRPEEGGKDWNDMLKGDRGHGRDSDFRDAKITLIKR